MRMKSLLFNAMVAAMFASGVIHAQSTPPASPTVIAAAMAEAQKAYDAASWKEARESFRKVAVMLSEQPQNGDVAALRQTCIYNAACCAARDGDVETAFSDLEALLALPYYDTEALQADTDFTTLREKAPSRWTDYMSRMGAAVARAYAKNAEGRIIVPLSVVKEKPVYGIIALHGGGGNAEQMEGFWKPLAEELGMVVIIPAGTEIYSEGSFGWRQRDPTRDMARIDKWLSEAKQQVPSLDMEHLILMGYSQGGGQALLLGAHDKSHPWLGVIALSGYVQVAERGRLATPFQHPTNMYVIVGQNDEPAIRETATNLAKLDDPKARIHVVENPGAGHELNENAGKLVVDGVKWLVSPPRGDPDPKPVR